MEIPTKIQQLEDTLVNYRTVIIVVPCISTTGSDRRPGVPSVQYKAYLDKAIEIYQLLKDQGKSILRFIALGGNHKVEGILSVNAAQYIRGKLSKIPLGSSVRPMPGIISGHDAISSVEEAADLARLLSGYRIDENTLVIIPVAQSQEKRYKMHLEGWGLDKYNIAFVTVPKTDSDYHTRFRGLEVVMQAVTRRDRTWTSLAGLILRVGIAYLRSPDRNLIESIQRYLRDLSLKYPLLEAAGRALSSQKDVQ